MLMYSGLPGLVLMIAVLAIVTAPFFQLWKRTGHSGWISLLMLIPPLNFILLYVLAFKRWPALDGAQLARGDL